MHLLIDLDQRWVLAHCRLTDQTCLGEWSWARPCCELILAKVILVKLIRQLWWWYTSWVPHVVRRDVLLKHFGSLLLVDYCEVRCIRWPRTASRELVEAGWLSSAHCLLKSTALRGVYLAHLDRLFSSTVKLANKAADAWLVGTTPSIVDHRCLSNSHSVAPHGILLFTVSDRPWSRAALTTR